MSLRGEQIAQIAYGAGFRGEQLVQMVAIAKRESGWNPSAHRSDRPKSELSGDRGLWQINSVWDKQLMNAGIIRSKGDLLDPNINARAAMYVMQNQGLYAWGVGDGGWQAGGDPFHKTNLDEARRAVQSASSTGLIATPYSGGGGVSAADVPSNVTEGGGPFKLPAGGEVFSTIFGDVIIFRVAPGVNIQYLVGTPGSVQYSQSQVRTVSNEEWQAMFPEGVIEAGDAMELAGVSAVFGSYGKMWESIVGEVMGYNNPAKDDPGVLAILAEFAARPNMSEAELQNKLQATDWYQERTTSELEWNDLSEAERQKRLDEMEARMIATAFQFIGEYLSPDDPRIANYLEDVAKGKVGFGAYTEILKGYAAENPESPHSRTVRAEEEAQKQRPIDIENTAQRVRETAERWGVGWGTATIQQWARDMVEKNKSDEDLLMELRRQAQVLYPWKDPETETMTAAAPWLETYRRVMERDASLSTKEIQKALQSGTAVFDFETELKMSDGWLTTKNGQDEMYTAISEMGRMMGFV